MQQNAIVIIFNNNRKEHSYYSNYLSLHALRIITFNSNHFILQTDGINDSTGFGLTNCKIIFQ